MIFGDIFTQFSCIDFQYNTLEDDHCTTEGDGLGAQ